MSVLILPWALPLGTPKFVVSTVDFRDFFPCILYQQTGVADLCQTSSIFIITGTHSSVEFNFLVVEWSARRNRQASSGCSSAKGSFALVTGVMKVGLFFQGCVELPYWASLPCLEGFCGTFSPSVGTGIYSSKCFLLQGLSFSHCRWRHPSWECACFTSFCLASISSYKLVFWKIVTLGSGCLVFT